MIYDQKLERVQKRQITVENRQRDLVVAVPNFSEGQDPKKIEALAQAIRKYEEFGVVLLGVEPERSYNRVVITFAGEPNAIFDASFDSIKAAYELIDMTKHSGQHPRIGAADVVPFVPLTTSMETCISLARRLAQKVAEELDVPVYLYGEAAIRKERRDLAFVRKGEYEGLEEKLKTPDGKPDFGPAKFVPRFGACVIGARFWLIAYNITLDTSDVELAQKIARRIRESGYKGVCGKFKKLKAIGIKLEDRPYVQVSCNLVDYRVTGLADVFEEVKKLAREKSVEIVDSEIIGFTPKEPIVLAGRFYAQSKRLSEEEFIDVAIDNLKLKDFEPHKKIIEYILL